MIPYSDPADKINDLVDSAIDALADDNMNIGADAILELAQLFAVAGLGIESFQNMRKFIIDEATKKTDAVFIAEKLKIIEGERQKDRMIISYQGGTC